MTQPEVPSARAHRSASLATTAAGPNATPAAPMAVTRAATAAATLAAALLAGCAGLPPATGGLSQIENIVVIYAENRSFDHLYGLFPGANGLANATAAQTVQLDLDGKPLPHLPPVYDGSKVNPKYPANLPNGPFRIDAAPVNVAQSDVAPSPIHAFYQNREQIDGGRNDRFVALTNVGAWTMGHFDGSKMRLWQWAKEYTLADNFFMAAYGGSFLNHQWLICACTPEYRDAPAGVRAQLDEQGNLKRRPSSPKSVLEGPVQLFDGMVTPDGYAVNTAQPPYQPSGAAPAKGGDLALADPELLPVPPQTAKTVGDTLSAKGVTWAWYAGAWNRATADGRRDRAEKREVIYSRGPGALAFQPHHQPFNYFARFAPGTADRERHLKDGDDFERAIESGTLPQVAFYKPTGRVNQHPSYTDLASGDAHIADLLEKLRKSPQWPRMAVIVTYDENGGFWDHAAPPSGPGWSDRWGPGTRIPALIVSPYARKGHVDHTAYDTTSIIKLITRRFDLEPLPGVRANAGDLTAAFAF